MLTRLILACFCLVCPLVAQDSEEKTEEKKRPWTNKTTISGVQAAGNSESTTFSFREEFQYNFNNDSLLKITAGGIRAESTLITPFAVGSEDDFTVEETRTTVVSAEQYRFGAKYEKTFTKTLHWFVAGAWDRNQISGIDHRFGVSAGVGRQWSDTDTLKLKSSWGLAHTNENRTFEPEDFNNTFGSYYMTNDLTWAMSKTTSFSQEFVSGFNMEDSDDILASLKNSLTVSMTTHLSLAVSADFAWDNQPAYIEITDATGAGSFPAELEKLDTLYKTSLVISF